MAITAATKLSDFSGFITAEMAQPYFEATRQRSVAQQLARQVPLGATGVSIPVVSTKPTASWVSEGDTKPATAGALALKSMSPKKIAAIAVVSAEVVRANPGNYVNIFRNDIAEAFALAFDAAAFHGTSTPFGASNYIAATTKSVTFGTTAQGSGGIYADVISGLSLLTAADKKLTGFAFDSVVEPTFLAATDTTGRPIFIDTPLTETAGSVTPGRLIGRPAFLGQGVADGAGVVGFGGDWSQAVWGSVGGITYSVSTEASVTINGTLVSMWEKNLVGIIAEAEFGWLCNDTAAFVKYNEASS
ncbi:MAG: phage major capsid protein [Sphaerochaeta sp.]|jgi:HK97 family phage major capsid protein|nr:phage major capsid protein [Sphaerochaeta sp.]